MYTLHFIALAPLRQVSKKTSQMYLVYVNVCEHNFVHYSTIHTQHTQIKMHIFVKGKSFTLHPYAKTIRKCQLPAPISGNTFAKI